MLGIQRRDFRRHIIGLRCMFMSMCRKFVHVPYSFVHAKCDAMASEAGGKSVSLAYRNLTELPRELAARRHQLESLDLSHNRFSDLRSLSGLSNLSTLVLDSNEVNSHVVFPSIPKLEVLWVNKNKITNLSVFVEAVASSFPLLTHLSMMNNSAAPSYFNGGSLQEYEDYRHFVISHLPKLCFLDDSIVSAEEREAAEKVYGRRRLLQTKTEDQSQKRRRSQSARSKSQNDDHYL